MFRDMEALKSSGLQLYFDKVHGGYKVRNRDFSKQLLDAEEIQALVVAAASSPLSRSRHFAVDLNQAIAKLMSGLSPTDHEQTTRLIRGIVVDGSCGEPLHEQEKYLPDLIKAISSNSKIRISYREGTAEPPVRTKLLPYRLQLTGKKWLLHGRSTFHRANITISLDQIETTELLPEEFRLPQPYLFSGSMGSWKAEDRVIKPSQ